MTLEFEQLARDPDTWLRASDRQVIVARELYEALKESIGSRRHETQREVALFEGWMYHAGMAIELATKAAIVRLEPERVMGKLRLPGHTEIPQEIEHILGPLSLDVSETLGRYSGAVNWHARYPVPLNRSAYKQHKDKKTKEPDHRILFDILQKLRERAG